MKSRFKILSLLLAGFLLSSCVTTGPTEQMWRDISTNIAGEEYVPLMTACEVLNINYEWDALTKKHILYKNESSLSFTADDPFVSINGRILKLSAPPVFAKGNVMIPRELAQLQWWKKRDLRDEFQAIYPGPGILIDKIVIDAGHGGKDHGCKSAGGTREKEITLAIAKRLQIKLEELGFRTVMTRTGDHTMTLPQRAFVANNSGADLFVSIHANAARNRSVRGFEIFYLSKRGEMPDRATRMALEHGESDEWGAFAPSHYGKESNVWEIIHTENRRESSELARAINTSVKRYPSISNRGIKRAAFFVLKWSDKPAVLVETGFLTNRDEARRLISPAYQEHLAGLIAEGILAYKAEYERTRGFTTR